ncbi:efflux RND transporter periplasmic adaptor subunit [Pigmentiphaga litoralis]|uniref:Multidrug efflux system membrane fusion protein n=1 Tax=Pigmentiphaga litoralis TaxID=516702 RepID=A0A7Y9IST2_9BURK|nr:efflux RND transporter periplasmic adaptor subunit [Pigmentiphaga litoralis]NYE23995.1 multidrug efflux system membrane fusion protein [Pigmentiphaga litoralis]NYE82391.1 multidrug efflux system membrane fusion protein [Pigmentiphaga litoralis]
MSQSPFRRHALWWATGALLSAGGAVAVAALVTLPAPAAVAAEGAPGPQGQNPPVRVTTVQARQQDVPVYLAGNGLVTPNATVAVKSRIDGQLVKIGFVEGQEVKEGQVLAELDSRTLEAQLAQVKATKARDQAQLANAKRDLQRYTQLAQQDAATQQQVDNSTALVEQLSAAVQADDAAIQLATVQLSFTRITAPISGRIGARLVDVGNIVRATDTTGLVVINRIDPISVVFTLPEEAVQEINRAQRGTRQALPVHAFARNGGDKELSTGSLILVNNQIDTATGTVQLKGSFPNASHVLWPGQYVNVRLTLGARQQAITIPSPAVQRGQDGTYVWAVDEGNKATRQAIHVAQMQEGMAVVDQGLQAGQRVVVDGQYKLRPGSTVIEPPANAGNRGAAK